MRATATALAAAREKVASLKDELKAANEGEEALEKQLFAEMAETGMSSFTDDILGLKFSTTTKRFPHLADKLKEAELYDFLREKGYGDAIRTMMPPSTLKASLKELADAGVVMPDYVQTYEQIGISVRKAKA